MGTVRGSGTNGYVQRNTAFVHKGKDDVKYKTEEDIRRLDAQANRDPNQGILDHERKRKLEVKCMELEEVLEEQGYKEAEVLEKVTQYRKMLLSKEKDKKAFAEVDEFGRPVYKETHQIAEAQKEKNARLKEAFGISTHFVEGSSFDPNRRELEDAARQAARGGPTKDFPLLEDPEEKKKKKKKPQSSDSSSSSSSDSDDHEKEKEKKKKTKRSNKSKSKEKKRSRDVRRSRDRLDASEDRES